MRFATYYVLWINVMLQKTEVKYSFVASAARLEAYFNDIKNITFSDEGKSIRADKFVIKHVRFIDSICKIERAAPDNRVNTQKDNSVKTNKLKLNIHQVIDDETGTSNVELYSDIEENWRGLNPPKKIKDNVTIDIIRKKRKYLTACPDITFIHNRPLRKKRVLVYKMARYYYQLKLTQKKYKRSPSVLLTF